MESKRILIIGCCGSGKSTLARKLNEKLNIPHVHLDRLFWRSGWKSVSEEEFDKLLNTELQKENWIIDGNYNRTLETRLEHADTVVYLDYSRIICMWSIIKRVIVNYGKTRPDMSEKCPERFDWEFIKYTWNFNKTFKNKNYQMLKKCQNKNIHIFKNRKQCNKFLKTL